MSLLTVWGWFAVGGLCYALVGYAFMASPARRSLRSLVFPAVTTPLLGITAVVRPPLDLAVIAGVAGLWMAGLWDLNHVLAPMDPREVRFDQRLGDIRRQIRASEDRIRPDHWGWDRPAHLDALERAIAQARDLVPPSGEWSRLRDGVVRALEFDADIYAGSRRADGATGAASLARWEQVKRQWDAVRSARSRFLR